MQRLAPILTALTVTMAILLTVVLFADTPPAPSAAASRASQTATTPSPVSVTQTLKDLLGTVEEMEPSRFTGGRKKLFASRLATAVHRLQRGHDLAAASQLRSLLRTTDGCDAAGRPDRNDWVLDCEAQEILHRRLLEARRRLEAGQPSS